jgi:DNA-binding MarR family transcriptional regulator
MSLRSAYLAMHRLSDAALSANGGGGGGGVTADQFVVLCVLAEQDRITQQELVRLTFSDPNTMRAMLVLLEKRGLLSRRQHPADGRARSVVLTARGRALHARLWARSQAVRERLEALFGPGESEKLVELLGRISQLATANGGGPMYGAIEAARGQ